MAPCRPTPPPSSPSVAESSRAAYLIHEEAGITQTTEACIDDEFKHSAADGAYFGSVPLEIVLIVADSLSLPSLLSLLRTCRSIYNCFLHYSSIVEKKKKNSLLLLSAVESCKSECVKMLLGDGADPNVRSKDGSHALQIAAQYYSDDIIPQLLGSTECNPNLRDRCGRTALHYAVMACSIKKTTWLIGYADPDVRTAGPGWTPLHYAVFMGYKDIVELLCVHGAGVNKTDTSTRGTPLHFAYRYRPGDTEIRRILCRFGANKKAVDFLGLTPPNYTRARHRLDLYNISGCDIYNFAYGHMDSWFSTYYEFHTSDM